MGGTKISNWICGVSFFGGFTATLLAISLSTELSPSGKWLCTAGLLVVTGWISGMLGTFL